jgi:UDPglucose 6-dehydrogenase
MSGSTKAGSICVVGTGYVGMACLIGLADLGHAVRGYDILTDRIEKLRAGFAPYREAGLEESLQRHLSTGAVSVFTGLAEAVADADFIVIAVGTPALEDGSLDLRALETSLAALSALELRRAPCIVIRSTVPPGTCDRLAERFCNLGPLLCAPEFLREGSAVFDFLHPDRIIVGAETPDAAVPYTKLFAALDCRVIVTTRCNAELIKCLSNAYLALKISFANEVANICGALGTEVDDVLHGIGADHRIGREFLRPGIGFGGPCFEKDVKGVVHFTRRTGVAQELFSATLRVNDRQPYRVLEMLDQRLGDVAGLEIGVWGLAFKAGTDDVRDSLAIRILSELSRRGATMRVYDPAVRLAELPPGATLVTSALAAAEADALLVLTEWPQFAAVDPRDVAARVRRGVVVGGRNILNASDYARAELDYQGVGRPPHTEVPVRAPAYAVESLAEAL